MLISSKDEKSARSYLRRVPRSMLERGTGLYEEGAVLSVQTSQNGTTYTGIVESGQLFNVNIRRTPKTWMAACDCPARFDCKHCCALMLALLNWEPKSAETPAGTSSSGARIIAPAQNTRPARRIFADFAAEKLGRPLLADEKAKADEIEKLYRECGESRWIPENRLKPFLRLGSSGWGYQMHTVWPAKPADSWEAWLHLAGFLRAQKVAPPSFLVPITTDLAIDGLISAQERRDTIAFWQKKLAALPPDLLQTEPPVDLRVALDADAACLEIRPNETAAFERVKKRRFDQMLIDWARGALALGEPALTLWATFQRGGPIDGAVPYTSPHAAAMLNALLRNPFLRSCVCTGDGLPFEHAPASLQWQLDAASDHAGDYTLRLGLPDGSAPPPLLVAVEGRPAFYLSSTTIFRAPAFAGLSANPLKPERIPAPALETSEGLELLHRLSVPLPEPLARRARNIVARVVFQCSLSKALNNEELQIKVSAEFEGAAPPQRYRPDGWFVLPGNQPSAGPDAPIVRMDRSAMRQAAPTLGELHLLWNPADQRWCRPIGPKFAEQFIEWLAMVPPGIEVQLDPALASLRQAPVQASIKFNLSESGIDWFDLQLGLQVSDTELTPEEIDLLLHARGQFVRLGEKGWRRLAFHLSEEEEIQLADLGLNARDFNAAPQRVHALQLGKKSTAKFLSADNAAAIERRVDEIQMRVAPEVPAAICASLRPYQVEGFHFLAYLSTNRFGGVLADDMGLGKTIQTLTWLAWLRTQPQGAGPSLVVCPKSVSDNWLSESARFLPDLRVGRWQGGDAKEAVAQCDLLVANYAQLRISEKALAQVAWNAVILDEAQFIKNPTSQTARAACALKASHRLALTGTPIENRLLDLWSIMAFTMPGVLGQRTAFSKRFDLKADPLARRRLSARVRPFLLRRTKGEVAADLPDRIEEDLLCELEGPQATLYQAELKRARQHLLKLKTARDLDKARFNVLTSLLRLRQICCHPALLGSEAKESTKLDALFDLLEPILEQGSKVLVFSQFVEMLSLIQAELKTRDWRHFKLTGETENRGAMVEEFQKTEGGAVFLISLRAGGFGLNLTAASYVVLFDPWWNPAAENQAIDRTHRIGQTSKVIAYRLIVKSTIEEKIRALQRQKSALAGDVLGEETFAKALSMEDFQFLLT